CFYNVACYSSVELERGIMVECEAPEKPASWQVQGVPNYCSDRNTLPDLWAQVEKRGHAAILEFDRLVVGLVGPKTHTHYSFIVATAPARLHVIAALKACAAW